MVLLLFLLSREKRRQNFRRNKTHKNHADLKSSRPLTLFKITQQKEFNAAKADPQGNSFKLFRAPNQKHLLLCRDQSFFGKFFESIESKRAEKSRLQDESASAWKVGRQNLAVTCWVFILMEFDTASFSQIVHMQLKWVLEGVHLHKISSAFSSVWDSPISTLSRGINLPGLSFVTWAGAISSLKGCKGLLRPRRNFYVTCFSSMMWSEWSCCRDSIKYYMSQVYFVLCVDKAARFEVPWIPIDFPWIFPSMGIDSPSMGIHENGMEVHGNQF